MTLHTTTIQYEEFTRPDGSMVGLEVQVDFEVDDGEIIPDTFTVVSAIMDDNLRPGTTDEMVMLTAEFEAAYESGEFLKERVDSFLGRDCDAHNRFSYHGDWATEDHDED